MGYALFANRKLFYTDLVFELQMQLDAITQKRMNLIEVSSAVSDGNITGEEMANFSISEQLAKYNYEAGQYLNTPDAQGGIKTTRDTVYNDYVKSGVYNAQELQAISNILDMNAYKDYAENVFTKNISAEEHKLELEQKRIETKLTAAQKQLDAIEQAEAQAIDKATPKYAGLG